MGKTIYNNTIFILAVIFLAFSCNRNNTLIEDNTVKPNANSDIFSLNIHLYKREKSKDSHGSKYIINIINSKVTFKSSHFGFRAKPGRTKTFTLKPDVFSNLIDYIKKNSLNQNIHEKKQVGRIGLTVKLNVKLKLNGNPTKMVIHGMYNDWSRRKKETQTNIQNIRFYEKFENIVNALENGRTYF